MIRKTIILLTLVFATGLLTRAAGPEKRWWHYDFSEAIGPEWEYIQQPDSSMYRVYKGCLQLATSSSSLSSKDSPTFVGRCQETRTFQLDTKMKFERSMAGDEAGLTVYHMPDVHSEVYLQNLRGEMRVKMRYTLKNLRQVAAEKHLGFIDEVWLRVKCDGKYYSFFYSTDGKKYHWLERIDSSLMLGAVAPSAVYNDIRLGMYAWKGGTQYAAGVTWASFDFLDYREL